MDAPAFADETWDRYDSVPAAAAAVGGDAARGDDPPLDQARHLRMVAAQVASDFGVRDALSMGREDQPLFIHRDLGRGAVPRDRQLSLAIVRSTAGRWVAGRGGIPQASLRPVVACLALGLADPRGRGPALAADSALVNSRPWLAHGPTLPKRVSENAGIDAPGVGKLAREKPAHRVWEWIGQESHLPQLGRMSTLAWLIGFLHA